MYYSNGQLWILGNYKNGKADGKFEYFKEEEFLYTRGNYEKGKKEDVLETYHDNGQL